MTKLITKTLAAITAILAIIWFIVPGGKSFIALLYVGFFDPDAFTRTYVPEQNVIVRFGEFEPQKEDTVLSWRLETELEILENGGYRITNDMRKRSREDTHKFNFGAAKVSIQRLDEKTKQPIAKIPTIKEEPLLINNTYYPYPPYVLEKGLYNVTFIYTLSPFEMIQDGYCVHRQDSQGFYKERIDELKKFLQQPVPMPMEYYLRIQIEYGINPKDRLSVGKNEYKEYRPIIKELTPDWNNKVLGLIDTLPECNRAS